METKVFVRYQTTPDYVSWVNGGGLLIAKSSQISYSPKTEYTYGRLISSSHFNPENLLGIKIRSLNNPKTTYYDILRNHPSTSKALRELLKSRFWKPIMAFVTSDGQFCTYLHNYKTGYDLRICNDSICDLQISFYQPGSTPKLLGNRRSHNLQPTSIALPEYKIRFGYNGNIPEGIIDHDEAEVIISSYQDNQLVVDYILAYDDYINDDTIIIHQYVSNS